MLSRVFAPLRLIGGLVVAFLALGSVSLHAQALPQQDETVVNNEPVYVTVRIFQARAKKGSYRDLSDQVFSLPTTKLTSYEKWLIGIKNAYPDFKIELLQTAPMRIFKSPKPGVVAFGNQKAQRYEFHVLASNGIEGGTKPGTSLILEAEYHVGKDKPVSLAIHPFDAEEGMTYFFTNRRLGLDAPNYVYFVRPDTSPKPFEDDHVFLIFAASFSAKEPAKTARVLTDKEFANWQASATKKVEPTLPESVQQLGLKGNVQVSVEIGPDGRVAVAEIMKSSLPEVNEAALTAARQWEFPTSAFAENKQPVKGTLNFTFTPPPPKPAPPTSK